MTDLKDLIPDDKKNILDIIFKRDKKAIELRKMKIPEDEILAILDKEFGNIQMDVFKECNHEISNTNTENELLDPDIKLYPYNFNFITNRGDYDSMFQCSFIMVHGLKYIDLYIDEQKLSKINLITMHLIIDNRLMPPFEVFQEETLIYLCNIQYNKHQRKLRIFNAIKPCKVVRNRIKMHVCVYYDGKNKNIEFNIGAGISSSGMNIRQDNNEHIVYDTIMKLANTYIPGIYGDGSGLPWIIMSYDGISGRKTIKTDFNKKSMLLINHDYSDILIYKLFIICDEEYIIKGGIINRKLESGEIIKFKNRIMRSMSNNNSQFETFMTTKELEKKRNIEIILKLFGIIPDICNIVYGYIGLSEKTIIAELIPSRNPPLKFKGGEEILFDSDPFARQFCIDLIKVICFGRTSLNPDNYKHAFRHNSNQYPH